MPDEGELHFSERRRGGGQDSSPLATLRGMPALVVLERLPVPVLAVANDGTIVFANQAFAAMLDHARETVLQMKFDEIFRTLPVEGSAVSALRMYADDLVELAHRDGTTVRAKMSKSALIRANDEVALATFQDLTERLWVDEP